MEIYYAAVTRNSTILAQYATAEGNFDVLVTQILYKTVLRDRRIQIEKNENRYFILHNSNGLNVIMCCSEYAPPTNAFNILEQISSIFLSKFSGVWLSASSNQLQNDFYDDLKRIIDIDESQKKINKIKNNLEETQEIMMDALEQSIIRSGSLSEMEERAQSLDAGAKEFSRTARNIKIKMFCEKFKYIFIAIFLLCIATIIISVYLYKSSSKNELQDSFSTTRTNRTRY